MRSFIEQSREYFTYHTKPATRYTHFVGVPLVIFSLMVLLGFVHIVMPSVFKTDLAQICTLLVLIYYFILNWRLALVAVPIFGLMLWVANHITAMGPTKTGLWIFFITFVVGWTIQLAGHVIEGRRPALVDNLSQALIAPLFLIAEAFFLSGKMKELQSKIQKS